MINEWLIDHSLMIATVVQNLTNEQVNTKLSEASSPPRPQPAIRVSPVTRNQSKNCRELVNEC